MLTHIGYGDTSQLRQAVINKYRWDADFEMVVAPAPRLQTNETQAKYLDLSIRQKGADKTILVMNQIDVSGKSFCKTE